MNAILANLFNNLNFKSSKLSINSYYQSSDEFSVTIKGNAFFGFTLKNYYINEFIKTIDLNHDKDNLIINDINNRIKQNIIINKLFNYPDSININNLIVSNSTNTLYYKSNFISELTSNHHIKYKNSLGIKKYFHMDKNGNIRPVIIYDLSINPINYRIYISPELKSCKIIFVGDNFLSLFKEHNNSYFDDIFIHNNNLNEIESIINENWSFEILFRYFEQCTSDRHLTENMIKSISDIDSITSVLDMMTV